MGISRLSHPKPKVIIFLQARISSTRLPGKVLKRAYGKPLLGYLLDRLVTTDFPIVVLVPRQEMAAFDPLKKVGRKVGRTGYPGVEFFGGPKHDVLKRFYMASRVFPALHYIRVTGDNPFTSITCLNRILKKHLTEDADLSYFKGMPYGSGVEVVSRRALELCHLQAAQPYDREHVTPWLHRQIGQKDQDHPNFKVVSSAPPMRYRFPELRVTVDTLEDWNRFRLRVKRLKEQGMPPTLRGVIDLECSRK